jgi:hypothetical protein
MHTNNMIKILLIFFSVAIVIVLSVFAYMVFSNNPDKQAESNITGVADEIIPPVNKSPKKPRTKNTETFETVNNDHSVQNTDQSAEEPQITKEELLKDLNSGNPTSTQPAVSHPAVTSPTTNKTPSSAAAQKYLEEERAKEELKRKMLENLNK